MQRSAAGTEAYGAVALGRALNLSLARRPYGYEMITRLEQIGGAVAAETRAMYSITVDWADFHSLAVQVCGRRVLEAIIIATNVTEFLQVAGTAKLNELKAFHESLSSGQPAQ
jgi:hypothetical protein